jgi:monoamine oxidase
MSPIVPKKSVGSGKSVVVVGAGISGLYCARELARWGYDVEVLEATERCGGRIETAELGPGTGGRHMPSKAEMGPMRFELNIQPLMRGLLKEFKIKTVGFTPPTPAEPPIDYGLEPCYQSKSGLQLSSLELLKLGVYRFFPDKLQPEIDEGYVEEDKKGDKKNELRAKVLLRPESQKWIDSLGDADGSLDDLRRTAVMPGTKRPLRDFGFWNALYMTLSPKAVAKILHFGTFYHLMPDNPNAAEWAIFWLRLFQSGGNALSTVSTGVERVVQELLKVLDNQGVEVRVNHKVIGLKQTADKVRVEVDDRRPRTADHVILALPKEPLAGLTTGFPRQIREDLEAVIAFPLLKVFCVTKTPSWWKEPRKPQQGAWLAPTREVHYYPRDRLAKWTLILFYTDRPATAFWQPFVREPNHHHEAEKNKDPELKKALAKILFEMHWSEACEQIAQAPDHPLRHLVNSANGQRLLRALSDFRTATVKVDKTDPSFAELKERAPALVKDVADIIFEPERIWRSQLEAIEDYAIRDWSQAPYGAGCHAWKPYAKSWEARKRLAAFGFDSHETENLHVCGEAYSDYQGFIEGALRSASDTCKSILRGDGADL